MPLRNYRNEHEKDVIGTVFEPSIPFLFSTRLLSCPAQAGMQKQKLEPEMLVNPSTCQKLRVGSQVRLFHSSHHPFLKVE
jgi:hypothetical protein